MKKIEQHNDKNESFLTKHGFKLLLSLNVVLICIGVTDNTTHSLLDFVITLFVFNSFVIFLKNFINSEDIKVNKYRK